jgi:hypothetical protein
LQERFETNLPFWIIDRQVHEHADASHPVGLLGVRIKRQGNRRASNYFQKIASSHCLPQG